MTDNDSVNRIHFQVTHAQKDVNDFLVSDTNECGDTLENEKFSECMNELRKEIINELHPKLAKQAEDYMTSHTELSDSVEIPEITYGDYCSILEMV